MKFKFLNTRMTVSALVVSLMLCACGDSPETLMASAKDYLSKNDAKAAIIQLKNALQANPDSAEARFLLGTALLDSGDAVGAELELRKASTLKFSEDQLVPELAKAMLALNQAKKLTDEYGKKELNQPLSKASLQMSLATAYALQGMPDAAQAAVKASLAAEPGYVPALIAQARNKASQRDFDASLAMIDEVIAKYPKNHEAWKLKGDVLLYAKGKVDDALTAYRKSVEGKPDFLQGNTSVITLLLQQGNFKAAAEQLGQLKKFLPNHPQTKYLEAQLAFQNKDFKLARELVQQVLKAAPDYVPGLQLAGAVELQLNSNVQAEGYLSKAVQLAPDYALARRLLVVSYIRSSQPARALAALIPALNKPEVDPQLLAIAGEVYLQNGDVKKAEEYFSKVANQDPKNFKNRTSLALTRLMGGQVDSAFNELENVAASDTGTSADLALISAYLNRQEFDKALKTIQGLEKKQPHKPMAAYLRGTTLLVKRDVTGAKQSFNRALAIDPDYFPAVASLAALDLVDKKPDEAKKRFEAVLAKDPKNSQALLALADLAAKSGASQEDVVKLIRSAVAAQPNEALARLQLIDFYLRNKDPKTALAEAQNGVVALPENPELLEAMGRSQQAAGEFNEAITTYNKLAGMFPLSPRPYIMMADAQLAIKNNEAAGASLRKSLEIKPDSVDAQRRLIALSLNEKKYQEALATASAIQKQRPKEALGYTLEGDIYAFQKDWEKASQGYRNGLKQVNSTELALKLHTVYLSSGKQLEADKLASKWQKDNPQDAVFLEYLGDSALVRHDYAAGEKFYLGVLKLQPDSAVAYNNLAWATGKLNKDGAIAYAEKANTLVPNQPEFVDTLAALLLEKGEFAKAAEVVNKTLALQPQSALLKLNLAKIHAKSGNKELARKELLELEKLGDKFAAQAEVASLLKGL